MNYENTIIDNQAILEFRDGVEREVHSCTEALTECESMLNQYAMEILCNVDSSPYARIPVSDL